MTKRKRQTLNAQERRPGDEHRHRVAAELRRLDHDPLAAAELAELRQPEGPP